MDESDIYREREGREGKCKPHMRYQKKEDEEGCMGMWDALERLGQLTN